jgi:hypothetical protein
MPRMTEEVGDEESPKPERSLRDKGIENIMSCGVSPEGAVLLWEALVNMQLFAFTGVAFAVLAYFFYDGSYLGMFGLYLAYDTDHLDRILYESIVLLPADVLFFEISINMGVTLHYLLVGVFYILTAMILEVPGRFIRLLYRLASVLYFGWGYFVHFEVRACQLGIT